MPPLLQDFCGIAHLIPLILGIAFVSSVRELFPRRSIAIAVSAIGFVSTLTVGEETSTKHYSNQDGPQSLWTLPKTLQDK